MTATGMAARQRFVAIYARVSTQQQKHEGQSLDAQIERMKQVAALRFPDRELRIFQDVDSGTNDRRPGLRALTREIECRDVHAVVVQSIDRLWRNLREALDWIHAMSAVETSLLIWGEMVDTSSAIGKCWLQIQLSMAELESNKIGERMRLTHRRSAQQGRKGPGCRPFGWDVGDDKKLVPNDREQGVIDFVLSEREQQRSWLSCAKACNRLGARSATGRPFTPGGLSSCIEAAVERRRKAIEPATSLA